MQTFSSPSKRLSKNSSIQDVAVEKFYRRKKKIEKGALPVEKRSPVTFSPQSPLFIIIIYHSSVTFRKLFKVHLSASIKDIDEENWKEEVWDKEIVPNEDYLYKKPGYSCD